MNACWWNRRLFVFAEQELWRGLCLLMLYHMQSDYYIIFRYLVSFVKTFIGFSRMFICVARNFLISSPRHSATTNVIKSNVNIWSNLISLCCNCIPRNGSVRVEQINSRNVIPQHVASFLKKWLWSFSRERCATPHLFECSNAVAFIAWFNCRPGPIITRLLSIFFKN